MEFDKLTKNPIVILLTGFIIGIVITYIYVQFVKKTSKNKKVKYFFNNVSYTYYIARGLIIGVTSLIVVYLFNNLSTKKINVSQGDLEKTVQQINIGGNNTDLIIDDVGDNLADNVGEHFEFETGGSAPF